MASNIRNQSKALEKAIREHALKQAVKEKMKVRCPNCGEEIQIKALKNTCPKCGETIKIEFDVPKMTPADLLLKKN